MLFDQSASKSHINLSMRFIAITILTHPSQAMPVSYNLAITFSFSNIDIQIMLQVIVEQTDLRYLVQLKLIVGESS